jgi:hypothetical protein
MEPSDKFGIKSLYAAVIMPYNQMLFGLGSGVRHNFILGFVMATAGKIHERQY